MDDTKELYRYVQGKVIQQDYDWITSLEGECTYCLTDAQVQMILATVDYLGWTTRWYSETGTIDKQVILDLKGGLVEALMNGCCEEFPAQYRFTEDGMYQRSTDGGVTWEDAPEWDYRNISTVWPDPNDLGIVTTKCAAADSVVETFKTQINEQIANDDTYTAIAAVIVAVILLFVSAGTAALLSVQLFALAVAIFRFGVAAWKAAFTSTIWDDFRCMVFNAMDTDSSISSSGFVTLMANIESQFSDIVATTLKGYVGAAGSVGLTNMMRSSVGDPDANCDGCNSECLIDNWHVWNLAGTNVGTEIARGANWITVESVLHPSFGGSIGQIVITTENSALCCALVSAEEVGGESGEVNLRQAICGADFWPAATGIDFVDESMCTVYAYKTAGTAPFQIKFTFG